MRGIRKFRAVLAGFFMVAVCAAESSSQSGNVRFASLRFVTGSYSDSPATTVNLYRVSAERKLELLSQLIPPASARPIDDGGVRSINIVGPYLFVDHPFDAVTSTLVVSTATGKVVDDLTFNPEAFNPNIFSHIALGSPTYGTCDLWNVSTSEPIPPALGGPLGLPAEKLAGVCVKDSRATIVHDNVRVDLAGLRYSGDPDVSDQSAMTFMRIVGGTLVTLKNGVPDNTIMHVPIEVRADAGLAMSPGVKTVVLNAANESYLVLSPYILSNSGTLLDSQTLIFTKQRRAWSKLPLGQCLSIRLFGDWLSVVQPSASGQAASKGDEEENSTPPTPGEIDDAIKSGKLQAPESGDKAQPSVERSTNGRQAMSGVKELNTHPAGYNGNMSQRLVLYNLADQRKIAIEGAEQGIEAIGFLTPDLMLERSGNAIYLQGIVGNGLGVRELIVEDARVSQIHWAFQVD